MLSKRVKDFKIRKNFLLSEHSRIVDKFLFLNFAGSNKYIGATARSAFIELNSLLINDSNKGSRTKIVRRCKITGRGRGSIRTFGVSRTYLRNMLSNGVISGYGRSIW